MSVGPGVPDDNLLAQAARPGLAESVAYILAQSQRTDIAEAELARIADALGNQPEALLLAARLLAERQGATAAIYLEALDEHSAAAPETSDYPRAYRAAVLTSFEIVEHEPALQGHAATSLLALSAFLADGPVPASVLTGPADRYPAEIRPFVLNAELRSRALSLLDRLGLISNLGPDGAFVVAGLTKAVVRDLLAEADETATWQSAAAAFQSAASTPTEPEQTDVISTSAFPASRDEAIALFESAETLAATGRFAEALASHEAARAIFAALAVTSPDDLQAVADLAASHAKIGLTHAADGRPREGLTWLSSCRDAIADLKAREPGNELWSQYLASLDGQIAELTRSAEVEQEQPPPPAARAASVNGCDHATVNRLVKALKEPEAERVENDDEPALLVGHSDAADDEEPLPLEVDGERGPPKVFTAESLFAEEAGLAPPAPPPPRRTGFISRLFGRRD